jgi:hypothetical protein
MIAAAMPVRPPGVREAMRRAVRDLYEESWRFVLLNSALSVYVLAVLALAVYVPLALVLLLGAGALAAALVSAAVTVVETGSLTFVDVAESLRRSWRRGVVLAAALGVAVLATVISFRFYGGAGVLAWPLAVVVLYLAAIFGLYQLLLWPLAVYEREVPLRRVAREAVELLVRRPLQSLVLGVVLLAVNLAGLAAAVVPLLTLTIAYSFLAAAFYALPPDPALEGYD